jgi:hypothetical protein
MTGRGSVTPRMACGSRPVEGSPQLGAFPAVGIRQGPGSRGHGLMPPCRPRPTAGWQIAEADQGRNGHYRSRTEAEPDKPMAAISANRQSVITDKRRNGRNRSRTRTVARTTDRVEAKTDQPKDLLFRRLLTSKETYPALVAGFIIREQKFSGEQHE